MPWFFFSIFPLDYILIILCFSYAVGCHVIQHRIMYVILISSNMFTDWKLNFSCFSLCWPLKSLELFSSGSWWSFCYPIFHSCTILPIKIAEVIIHFSFCVITTKIWELLNPCCAKAKLTLRWSAQFVSLYSSVWVQILFLVLAITFSGQGIKGNNCPLSLFWFCNGFTVTSVSRTAQTDVWEAERHWEKKYFTSMIYCLFDLKRRCLDSF